MDTYDLAAGVGEAVRQALAGTDAGAPQRVIAPVAGQPTDDGCDCGLLTVATPNTYLSSVFPQQAAENHSTCGPPYLVAELTVRVMRCAPVGDDNGSPPTVADELAAARVLHTDKRVTRNAVGCQLAAWMDDDQIAHYAVGAAREVGPAGRCVGFELQVQVAVPHCYSCVG